MLNPGKNSAPVFIWANRDCTHSTILQQNQKDRPEGEQGDPGNYIFPCRIICCIAVCTTLDGMAKPSPLAGVLDSVLTAPNVGMPTSCPCKLMRAPPLLPGLMGASV